MVLIALKLAGVINWSWWLVLTPLWINLAIDVAVLAGWLLAARRGFKSGYKVPDETVVPDTAPQAG